MWCSRHWNGRFQIFHDICKSNRREEGIFFNFDCIIKVNTCKKDPSDILYSRRESHLVDHSLYTRSWTFNSFEKKNSPIVWKSLCRMLMKWKTRSFHGMQVRNIQFRVRVKPLTNCFCPLFSLLLFQGKSVRYHLFFSN